MSKSFRTQRRVEFRDTDAAGLMHFTAFFTKMEEVEHEFLRHLGFSVVMYDGTAKLSWPRVSAKCDYTGATRFEDLLDLELRISRLGEKSVTYDIAFSLGEQSIATGQVITVYCRIEPDVPPRSHRPFRDSGRECPPPTAA